MVSAHFGATKRTDFGSACPLQLLELGERILRFFSLVARVSLYVMRPYHSRAHACCNQILLLENGQGWMFALSSTLLGLVEQEWGHLYLCFDGEVSWRLLTAFVTKRVHGSLRS